MQPRTARFLDFWLGVPLCALLTLWRRIRPDHSAAPRKILFLKFVEQGATVLAQDAIHRATAMVGREQIYFCVFESNRAILDLLGTVPPANIISIRDRRLISCLIDFLKALRVIRSKRIDTSIDLEFFSRASAIFAFLSGAVTRVGLHRFTSELPYRGDLLTHRVQYSPYLHMSLQYALLVEASRRDPSETPLLKIPVASPSTRVARGMFEPNGNERTTIRRLLRPRDGSTEPRSPIVLLNPNASDLLPLRKWPGDRFVELGGRVLAEHPSALIVVTGAPSERPAADALCRQIGSERAISLAGRTTLRELLTLHTFADVLVTNDSGPAHFASRTPVSVVVLFGPETPQLFGPLSASSRVIWKQLACSPCVSVFNHRLSPCTDNVCMQSIGVDEVYAAVVSSIAARRGPASLSDAPLGAGVAILASRPTT